MCPDVPICTIIVSRPSIWRQALQVWHFETIKKVLSPDEVVLSTPEAWLSCMMTQNKR